MTRDEVLTMKPGRELDAMVAEKVMGWTYGHPCPEGMDCLHWVDEKGKVRDYKPPHYSTDISAAWEVVERMTSLFWEMNLDTGSKSNTTKVEFYRTFDQEFHVVVANTAPETICKAALLAVMEGEKDD